MNKKKEGVFGFIITQDREPVMKATFEKPNQIDEKVLEFKKKFQ